MLTVLPLLFRLQRKCLLLYRKDYLVMLVIGLVGFLGCMKSNNLKIVSQLFREISKNKKHYNQEHHLFTIKR